MIAAIGSEPAHPVEEAAPVIENVLLEGFLSMGEVTELIEPIIKTELKLVDDAVLNAVKGCKANHVTPHKIFPKHPNILSKLSHVSLFFLVGLRA